jgi:ABC-2 type transport system ATP-binding protein
MTAVSIHDIVKRYGDITALDKVSFDVREGEVFGIIGPDGAGKTTLFRILTTLLLPDAGRASLLGYDVVKDYRAIRDMVGYMPGRFSLYTDLTVKENLSFFATVFGTTIEANYDLIRELYEQIKPFANRRAGKLSGGMKQKLALCCALIHKPRILLLDEPTTGVDVVSRKELWAMLYRLRQQGITIIVSTPYMDEALRCDRIALMQSGKMMSIETPQQIVQQYPGHLYAVRADDIYLLLRYLRDQHWVSQCHAFGDTLHLTLNDEVTGMANLQDLADENRFEGFVYQQITPGIEDSFIRLMIEQTASSTHA